MSRIVQKEDPILRELAKEVPLEDINTEKIKKITTEMASALEKCEDGVALAAPQIGESLRIFVVSPRAFAVQQDQKSEVDIKSKREADKLIYINPVITRRSSKKVTLDEGCLSVRNIFGKIKRHEKVSLRAYDENGNKFQRGATGLLSEIFQHETDHLNGILFTDSASDLVKVENKQASHVR